MSDIKTISDAFVEAWAGNQINEKEKSYYLKGIDFSIQVLHEKGSSDILFSRYLDGKHRPWWVNWANFCGCLSSFSGDLRLGHRIESPNSTWKFSLNLESGQINFINGTLRVRGVKDFNKYLKELSKLNLFFPV